MTTPTPSPWMTRSEAAQYLGFADSETLDAHMIAATDKTPATEGKIRFRKLPLDTGRQHIRLWRADVLALLPPIET